MADIVEQFTDSNVELGPLGNPATAVNNTHRVIRVLYLSEKKFNVKELTARQISEILLKKYRINCSSQAVRGAFVSALAKGKIGSRVKDGVVYFYLLIDGIKEAENSIGSRDISQNNQQVIPHEIFEGQPKYITAVVYQINGCYDHGFYDACFVLIRRLIETLLIEVYERKGLANGIKQVNGDYLMFGDLVKKVINDSEIKTSRNVKRDLNKIKEFGDTAAHNRMLNLKQPDIDKYSDLVRMSCEELINNCNP